MGGAARAVVLLTLTAAAAPAQVAVPDRDWDAAFTRDDGWTGADACYSVDLADGRTLWLYGDTWIGPVVEGAHGPGSTLVNNSLGVHPTPEPGAAPAPGDVDFLWGRTAAGAPAAWVAPAEGETWFWTQGGVLAPSPDGPPRLVVFLVEVARSEAAADAWGFRLVGTRLAIVDDPRGPPASWAPPRQHALPHSSAALTWGAALLLEDGWLHVYGVREEEAGKALVLARVRPAHVERPEAWRFWDGAGWSEQPARAAGVLDGAVNELSVSRRRWRSGEGLVMVASEPALGTRILLRTAARPEGPWSAPRPVHDVALAEGTFTYAAKGHPHLSRPGELLVTYVVNGHELATIAGDASLYRPRFLRVDLEAALAE